MAHDDDDEVGQPTGQHSLSMCSAGEGKAWKGAGHVRFPQVREKHDALQVPSVEDGNYAELDYAIKIGPRGGKRKVAVGIVMTHEHGLTKHNLAKAYADFAATCQDRDMVAYAKVQAMAKTPQADGHGSKFAAWKDRPRPLQREPEGDGAEYVCEPVVPMHGMDCMCFDCLVKR